MSTCSPARRRSPILLSPRPARTGPGLQLPRAVSSLRGTCKGVGKVKEEEKKPEKGAGEGRGRGEERGLQAPPTNVQTFGGSVPKKRHLNGVQGREASGDPRQCPRRCGADSFARLPECLRLPVKAEPERQGKGQNCWPKVDDLPLNPKVKSRKARPPPSRKSVPPPRAFSLPQQSKPLSQKNGGNRWKRGAERKR